MAVRDGAGHVRAAVESVLGQTAGDLELLVVDDGSTDGTPDILSAVRDPRLRLERQPPRGLTRSLNRALALTSAPLVARLDADDVALPERLARQLAFLDAHPDTGLLGSAATERDAAGASRTVRPPEDDAAIRRALIRRNVFVHSTVMMRRAVVERVGGYDETLPVAQDYDLWLRLARVTRVANLPDVLVVRHLLPRRVSVSREDDRLRGEMRARWRAVRSGAYPWWAAIWVARAAAALAVPRPLRPSLRRLRG
jgi:glycosyltransferase involved in cell wall biosynthesis